MSGEFEGKKCDECHQNKQETVDINLPDGTHTVVCRECVEAIVEQFQAEEAIIPQPEPLTPRQGLAEYKRGYYKGWNACKYCYTNEDLREGLREDLREGISLRDHLAGLAMQVLLVDATSMNNAASNAYDMADLMLAERGKNENRT